MSAERDSIQSEQLAKHGIGVRSNVRLEQILVPIVVETNGKSALARFGVADTCPASSP